MGVLGRPHESGVDLKSRFDTWGFPARQFWWGWEFPSLLAPACSSAMVGPPRSCDTVSVLNQLAQRRRPDEARPVLQDHSSARRMRWLMCLLVDDVQCFPELRWLGAETSVGRMSGAVLKDGVRAWNATRGRPLLLGWRSSQVGWRPLLVWNTC